MPEIMNIAHRGASAVAPENTMAAYKQALAFGAGWLEIDIHRTRDGYLVAIHDPYIDRVTRSRGYVAQMTLAQLKQLDFGAWFSPAFAGERICTLEEIIAFARGRCRFNIELKYGFLYYPGIEEQLAELITRERMADEVFVSSFNYDSLARIKRLERTIRTAMLLYGYTSQLAKWGKEIGVAAFGLQHSYVTPELVAGLHAAGFTVYAWVANQPETIYRLLTYGVDGIVSDHPDRVRQILATYPHERQQPNIQLNF